MISNVSQAYSSLTLLYKLLLSVASALATLSCQLAAAAFEWLEARRQEPEIVLELPAARPPSRFASRVAEPGPSASCEDALPRLASRRRAPGRARVFVRLPSGTTMPADLDLTWTIQEALDYIFASVCEASAEGLGGSRDYSLRFKRRILTKETTLKENGGELGSVFGVVPSDLAN